MIENIYNFLTGGAFTTLKGLIENVIQWVITFITNTTYNFFEPIINQILVIIPFIEDIGSKINYLFNIISPYIGFILDFSLISKPILIYLILSIIFRISIKFNFYITKLILKWYKQLMP